MGALTEVARRTMGGSGMECDVCSVVRIIINSVHMFSKCARVGDCVALRLLVVRC